MWSFSETIVGDDDHFLPPDNYQHSPNAKVAHRTSPTNIGLYLLSVASANDLGYISLPAMRRRLEKTFATLDTMEKHRGHWLNWYDTRSLSILKPAYVSSVDSGNLWAMLICLAETLREKADRPTPSVDIAAGLLDAVGLLEGHWRPARVARPEQNQNCSGSRRPPDD